MRIKTCCFLTRDCTGQGKKLDNAVRPLKNRFKNIYFDNQLTAQLSLLSSREERTCTWCDKPFASVSMAAPDPAQKNVILHVRLYFF